MSDQKLENLETETPEELNLKYLEVPFKLTQKIHEDEEFFNFEGYASTFGNIDLGNDIVERGAFKDSLQRRMPKLLWQHQMGEPLGVFLEAFEDEVGLFVKGRMPKADTFVSGRVIPQMKVGSVNSMSIGFKVIDMEQDTVDGESIFRLKKIELFEVSIVTIPMNPEARITGIKTVVAFQDLPLASQTRPWDSDAAIKRVRKLTGSEDEPSASFKNAFLWFDATAPENFGSYKLPIADVIGGELKAVPKGIFAVAGVLQGARGGVDIPERDQTKIKRNVDKYYTKMGLESPFSKAVVSVISKIETLKDLNNYLHDKGLSNAETEGVMAKMKEILGVSKSHHEDGESKSHQEDDVLEVVDVSVLKQQQREECLKGIIESLDKFIGNLKGER